MAKRAALLALLLLVPSIGAGDTVHSNLWPSLPRKPLDPKIERAIDALLLAMSVEEKVGQILQPSIPKITPDEVRQYSIGSVLNGGGGWPGDVRKATPKDWLALADAYYDASMKTPRRIPVIWGSDAVHGHNNIIGATLFPHNIALGATRDAELLRRIGEVTAVEMAATGLDWDFSPTVAVARDDRWGRAYESYSEDPGVVRSMAKNMVAGLQQRRLIIATAKHFLGDGGTAGGKDQGDNRATETELRDIHLAGYLGALSAGVQTIMVSYNSWRGEKMHGNRALLTDVLKGRLNFDGFLVGDWNAHGQLPGCSNGSCPDAINAGLDMFMVPEDWKGLYASTVAQVRAGIIPMSRLDDAVRRILRVKMRSGLFTAGRPSSRPLAGHFELLGSREHRAVARRAVRESIVLLKNNRATLPLRTKQRILVAGDGADNIAKQCGGWTITWQGDGNVNADFPGATSIWSGIRRAVEAGGGTAVLSPDGSFRERPDAAIVVFGEDPYAEFRGDRQDIVYQRAQDLALLRRLRDAKIPVVSIFLSGRPLWINPYLNASDALVAAWLPGTEGAGVADVLFGKFDFRGKLSFSWPKSPSQVVLNRGDANYDPLFAFGYGLTYAERKDLPALPVDLEGVVVQSDAIVENGQAVAPWTLEKSDGGIVIRRAEGIDWTREANGGVALAFEVAEGAGAPILRWTLNNARLDLPRTTGRVRLSCFGADLARVDTIGVDVPIRSLRLIAPSEPLPCPAQ